MKNLKITKERVLEAAEECTESKQVLKKLFPEVFEREFEKGKWYRCETKWTWLMCVSHVKDGIVTGYGIDVSDGDWHESLHLNSEFEWYEATKEEVEDALIKEAKKKYNNGYKLKSTYSGDNYTFESDDLYYSSIDKCLYCNKMEVMSSNGEWATIIEAKKEMTMEELEEELGYAVKIVK